MITTDSIGIGQDWQRKFCLRDHSQKWLDRACAFYALQCDVSRDIVEAGGAIEPLCTLMKFDIAEKSKPPELFTISMACGSSQDKAKTAALVKTAVQDEQPDFAFTTCEAWCAKVDDVDDIPDVPVSELPDREEICVVQMSCRMYGYPLAVTALAKITRSDNVSVEPFSKANVAITTLGHSQGMPSYDRYSECWENLRILE